MIGVPPNSQAHNAPPQLPNGLSDHVIQANDILT